MIMRTLPGIFVVDDDEAVSSLNEAGPVRVDRRRHRARVEDEPLELTGECGAGTPS